MRLCRKRPYVLTDIVTKKLKDKGDVQVVLGSPSAAASSLQTLTLSEPATTPVPSSETAATAVPSASSAGDVNNQLTEAYQHLNKGNKKVGCSLTLVASRRFSHF